MLPEDLSGGGSGGSAGGEGGGGGGYRVLDENAEFLRLGDDEKCPICMDEFQQIFCLSRCGHNYCRECLQRYLKVKITDGEVFPKCFHTTNSTRSSSSSSGSSSSSCSNSASEVCGEALTEEDIEMLLGDDEVLSQKYSRFLFTRNHPDSRECPGCYHLCLDREEAKIICPVCSKEFCYFHGGAHTPSVTSCEKYEAAVEEETRTSQLLIDSTSKPCPGCRMPISKISGCNHMKCSHCGVAWCWLCGKEIDDAVFPVHFQWWNPSACSNLQMNGEQEPNALTRCLARGGSYFEIIVFGPLSCVSTILSLILCCCCIPTLMQGDGVTVVPIKKKCCLLLSTCMSGWGMFWIGLIVFLPLGIVAGVIILLCWLFVGIYWAGVYLVRCCRCACCANCCCSKCCDKVVEEEKWRGVDAPPPPPPPPPQNAVALDGDLELGLGLGGLASGSSVGGDTCYVSLPSSLPVSKEVVELEQVVLVEEALS